MKVIVCWESGPDAKNKNYSLSQASAEDDGKEASSNDGSDRSTDSDDDDDDGDNDGGEGDEKLDDVEAANPTELQEGGNLSLRSEVAKVICSYTCKKFYQNKSNGSITKSGLPWINLPIQIIREIEMIVIKHIIDIGFLL